MPKLPWLHSSLLLVPLACCPLLLLPLNIEVNAWTVFTGRFHSAVLHLPIGILIVTALTECLTAFSRSRLTCSTHLPMFFGALTAVAAAVLGLLLANGENLTGTQLESHQQWGIATAVLAVLALSIRCIPQYARRRVWPAAYRAALLLTCAVLIRASHQGASMVHGETYLTEHSPWQQKPETIEVTTDAPLLYEHTIAPIFEAKCNQCHKQSRVKGELMMDTYEGLLRGGATGPGIVPGEIESSLIIARMHLPAEDEEFMPPKKKPQITPEELQLIESWVEQGAATQQNLKKINPVTM